MGLENQNHGDFDGFSDITLINWKELECADDSIAVLCDQRPIELYGKIIWKPCLFGYICMKKVDYYYEFPRCIELGLDFKAIICNSAYEYPANFNCDFYDKFFCQRSKRYIYSCICANNYRNADMKTCANTTVCSKGLPEKKIILSTTTISEKTIVHTTTEHIFQNYSTRTQTILKPQKKCHPGAYLPAFWKAIFFILSALNCYYNSR